MSILAKLSARFVAISQIKIREKFVIVSYSQMGGGRRVPFIGDQTLATWKEFPDVFPTFRMPVLCLGGCPRGAGSGFRLRPATICQQQTDGWHGA
jgi:hypothetical protein